jgi:hypothetical protein
MDDLSYHKILDLSRLFGDRFPDAPSLYLYHFGVMPSIHLFSRVEGEKALKAFSVKFGTLIRYSCHHYTQTKRGRTLNNALVVLDNGCIAEFGEGYAQLLYDGAAPFFLEDFGALMTDFRARARRKPLEINVVIRSDMGLDLRAMEIKKTRLDVELFYEDDFGEVDKRIRKRLGAKNDKGIVLLHGLPGTGKTTYLRYLVGQIRKKVLFLSPSVAGDLMNPDFIDLLMDNRESVLFIEDAENIVMSRKAGANSSVSNLLNISDGLLADFLNVQIVCTFNHSLADIDSALIRKGRLIAGYEFGRLSVGKARRLSAHLGFHSAITRPMTLAEITHPHEPESKPERPEPIGFNSGRRHDPSFAD